MEVCGYIFNNNDCTDFSIKCLYCTSETLLKDWEKFVLHVQQEHNTGSDNKSEFTYDDGSLDDAPDYKSMPMDTNPDDELETWDETEIEVVETFAEMMPSENEVEVEDDIFVEKNDVPPVKDVENDVLQTEFEVLLEDANSTETTVPEYNLEISFRRHNLRISHFIDAYKGQPCLWNNADPNYDNEEARGQAYKSLMEYMEKTANIFFTQTDLTNSIEQLHNQYAIATDMAKKSRLRGLPAQYFARCDFLKDADVEESDDKESELKLNFQEKSEFTSFFINLYSNYPELYNPKLKEYKSIPLRKLAYIKMAEDLSTSAYNETHVYMGIVQLRKWFCSAIKRIKAKTRLTRPCSKAELQYLKQCSFLPHKVENMALSCEVCSQRFYMDYNLRTHLYKQHGIGELPYLCSKCPRRFETLCDMTKHNMRQHIKKQLKCSFCSSTFAVSYDLAVHTRIHTGEKPFVCEVCGKGFRLKLLLDYHINGVHLNLRPFKCKICTKDFRKKFELEDHMKAHLNIRDKKCHVCGKDFTSYSSLSRHRKLHEKNKLKNY